MQRVELCAGGNNPAGAQLHGDRIPWFGGTKAVQMTRLQVRHHLWGRHYHDANIPFRIDSEGGKPAPEQVAVR